MSSKEINGTNIEKLSPLGDMTKPDCEHVLALDGIAIVTHPSNKIKTLNLSQLRKIYSGEIRNWNQINPDQSELVKLFRRDEHSGTHEMFKKMVMKKNTINDEAKISLDNDTMIKEINLHSNSIGYISSTYAKDVKILSIQSDNVRSYKPTTASIQTEEYPLSRRLYLYSPERSLNKYLNSFLEFSLSTPGQKVVQSSGFIPQIIRLIKPEIEGSFSQQYIDIIQNAMRINMNFRFNKARSEIDNH